MRMADTIDADEEAQLQETILAWAREYAASRGWRVNPNDKQLGAVIKGLARNTTRFGEQYCPCRMRTGDTEKDREIVCPCIFHEDEITNDGYCHCRLFFDSEK
jgi:ferredoxin-thioredoxin reductase catalytic subunit